MIGDFDTAKSLVDSEAKTITGTTNYIAPEVFFFSSSLLFYFIFFSLGIQSSHVYLSF